METKQIIDNRIDLLFREKKEGILSVYFTAGFPRLEDTQSIILSLQKSGADMIEVGIPFSDPVADGPTIQSSNQQALDQGMHLGLLMDQLKEIKNDIKIPIIMMGYLNPVIQYGVERFCARCQDLGIDGLILPDLPVQEYLDDYQKLFIRHQLHHIFLVTPQTTEDRIRWIDDHSDGFIYAVASASTTGAKSNIDTQQISYFEKLRSMQLRNPWLIGFGISNQRTFDTACQFGAGAIIGSAFIKELARSKELVKDIRTFIASIKGEPS
ncbi:MAG: tryptophan synthase subunit alpha [Cyclobacteriaceae bacterium]